MRHYLIQTGGGSAVPYFTRLSSRLPDGFADRPDVILKNLGPASDDSDTPRVVASFDADDAGALAALENAMAALANPAFTLATDPPELVTSLTADPGDIDGLLALMPEFPDRLDEAEDTDDPFPEIEAIFATASSGLDFPELAYEGGEAKAYQHIVKLLGDEPRLDRAVAILPGRIRDLRRPPRIRAVYWDPVVEHLENELLYFTFTRSWMGDSGHLMLLNDRQTDINFTFLEHLGETYLGLSSSHQVTLVIDTMWTLAFKAAGQLGGPTAQAASFMQALWKITAGLLPDPKAVTTARIDKMKEELTQLWAKQMSMLGTQHEKINGDWGLLERFGKLVTSRALRWPEDFSGIRRSFSWAFQIYALKETLVTSEAGAEMVVKEEVPCKPARTSAGWWVRNCHPKGSRDCFHEWALKSKSYKTGDWCFIYYLGYRHHDPLSRRNSLIHANRPIQRKFFGTDLSSELDPDFAFPSRFLTDPTCAERKGWGLGQWAL